MVYMPLLQEMRKEYNENLQQYVQEHPGEYVLFEVDKTTFYKTKKELSKATAKYKGLYGPTFLVEKIPVKTHRFNKDNKTLDFIDDYVAVCPNDNETELLCDGAITHHSEGHSKKYQEIAYCPDCSYKVFRKPSEKRIKESEERMRNLIFK